MSIMSNRCCHVESSLWMLDVDDPPHPLPHSLYKLIRRHAQWIRVTNKNILIKVHLTTRKKKSVSVLNFAKALSEIVLVCCHTQGNRCCKALSPTTGRKWGLRKRNYPLSPTWQVRGQTCSLLAEQETCFLSLLGLFWPWLPASRFESEIKQMLRQGRKCFASLLHREGESVRWYEAENRVVQRRTYQTMLWWCGDLL